MAKLAGETAPSNTPARRKTMLFEPLEPRLLLNADLPVSDILINPDDNKDQDILVRIVNETQSAGEDGQAVHQLQVVDLSNGESVLTSADVSTISKITLDLGDGDDRITIDVASFGDLALPQIDIDGGDGQDELVVNSLSATVWDITGTDAGQVLTNAAIDFNDIEQLTGSANNEDTFILNDGASVSGGVDGGAAGYDVLEINGSFNSITSTIYDASSGLLDLDGTLIAYTGLEPVTFGGTVANISLLGTTGDDQVVLEAGPAAGTFQLRSANGTFETHIFTGSVDTLTLGLSTGQDSFTSTLTDADGFAANVIIAETANLTIGDVTGIDGNFTVDTISAVNSAEPGELDFDGSAVTILDGAEISISGDFSVTVNAYDILDASNIQEWISAPIIKGAIDVGDNVTIDANDVKLEVIASNERQIFLSIDATTLVNLALEDALVGNASGWQDLTLDDIGDGTAALTRSSGSWLADGFAPSHDLLIFNADDGINQNFRVLEVTAGVITVELKAGTTLPAASLSEANTEIKSYDFVRVSGDDQIVFGLTGNDTDGYKSIIARQVPVDNPDAELTGAQVLTFTHNDSANDTITRSNGNWEDDGFVAGQTIEIMSAGVNNGTFVITAVSGQVLSLGASDTVTTQGGVTAAAIRGHMLDSFVDEGFQVGDLIVVQGSEFNDKTYTIAEVHDRVLVLDANDIIYGETIDLSAAPDLLIQKVKDDLALADLPLVLLDADGQTIRAEDGTPLSFTQAELEAAYAAENDDFGAEVLSYLVDNPLTDFLGGFGLRILVSDLSSSVIIGSGTQITAAGDVSVTSSAAASVDGSTPSVVAGLSVVFSKVSSSVHIKDGVTIDAEGAVTVDASSEHSMTAGASVTSGSIMNPLQSARTGLQADTANRIDPTVGAVFSTLQGFAPSVSGFVRVPGPAIAVAIGIADTDSKVTIDAGSEIAGQSVTIGASNKDNYSVSASSIIYQPGANQGFGIAAAISITQSDAVVDIAGDISTHDGGLGDIVISATSVSESNDVSSSAWVRESQQGVGGIGGIVGLFSDRVASFQSELRAAQEIGDHLNENPGKLEAAAGLSILASSNKAEVILSSQVQAGGTGGIKADGNLTVSSYAEENPNIGAAGTAESGGEIAISGGVAFASYANTATTRIKTGADLTAGGAMSLTSQAIVPVQNEFDDLFYGNFADAISAYETALEDAALITDPVARAAAEAAALTAYNGAMAEASLATLQFPLDLIGNRQWGFAGLENYIFTSYVNSGSGGDFASNDPSNRTTVLDANGKAVLNSDGTAKTQLADFAKQSADYAIAGNINILNLDNSAETIIEDGVTAQAGEALIATSDAQMATVNVTGLTSLWDIFWSAASTLTGDDDGASISGAQGGVGASLGFRVLDNTARTKIGGDAVLASDTAEVALRADSSDVHVNMHEIGSDGGEVSISGSFSVDVMSVTTEVLVDESAKISAGTDVVLDATSDLVQINVILAGSESNSGTSVGAAVGLNVITSTTRAEIADLDGSIADNSGAIADPNQANIQAGGNVVVDANRQETVVEVAIAGARKSTGTSSDGGVGSIFGGLGNIFTGTDPNSIFNSNAQALGGSGSGGTQQPSPSSQASSVSSMTSNSEGVTLAGAIAIDVNNATVTAKIGDGSSVNADGTVTVFSDYNRELVMVDGGFALDTTSEESTAALAGGFGIGVATRTVDALISGAVIQAGAVDVDADRSDILVAIALGGAGSARSEAVIGGSVNVHVFDNNVHAKIIDSTVTVSGDASVKARSDSLIVSIAGAAGVVLEGGTGVGAAFGVTAGLEEVHAYIDNSMVVAGGDVIVHAHNEVDIISVVASLGISATGDAGSGQLTLHLVTTDVDARIGTGSTIEAGNNVAVVADDSITMVTVTGGVALGREAAVGVAISSTNIYDRKVKAHIDDGASVTADAAGDATTVGDVAIEPAIADGVLIKAVADDDIINVVVGVSVSGSQFAGQGSVLIDTNNSTVHSYIGTDSGTAGNHAAVTTLNGGDVVVDAYYDFVGVSIVGSASVSLGSVAAGASVNVSVHHRTVNADIGRFAVINSSGSLNVDAELKSILRTVVFSGSVAGSSGSFGGAITVAVFNDFVTAQVMGNAGVAAGDDVIVSSRHDFAFTLVDAAGALASSIGLSGSFGIVVQNATTKALVGEMADIVAQDTVVVEAVGTAALQNLVGGVAVGGSAALGGSGFVLVRRDEVASDIGDEAMVTGLALGAGVLRTNLRKSTEETVSGVALIAESEEDLIGVALQGALSKSVALSGSLPISAITEITSATTGTDASINQAEGAPGADQDVVIRAYDDTLMVTIAGNLALSKEGAFGVGADITSIVKETTAAIGPMSTVTPAVVANRDIRVEASGKDNLVSIVVGISGSSQAALGGNGSIYVLDVDTVAKVEAGATVTAEGSVIIDAAHHTETDQIVLSGSGSGILAVSGGLAITVVDKTVHAFIAEGASVTGKGLRDALSDIHTGRVVSGDSGATTDPAVGSGGLSNPGDLTANIDGSLNIGAPSVNSGDTDTTGMFAARDFRAELLSDTGDTAGFKGVSVTATNIDDLMTISGAIAGAGTAAIGGSLAWTDLTANTQAFVSAGATVNGDNGEHGADQSVQVAAGSAFDHLGIVAAAGGAGTVAAVPVAHVVVGNLTTTAKIDGATVNANNNIAVRADAHQDIQAIDFALAGSGSAAIAPAISVIDLESTTTATIMGAADVESAGNVLVSAFDETNIDAVQVALAGSGGGSVGASFGISSVIKTTEASIGTGAHVDARATSADGIEALSGESTDLNDTEIVHGLVVDARSFEDVDSVAFGAAAGGGALGGALAVQVIDSDTIAAIHNGAVVNAGDFAADSQSVSVGAYNKMDLFSVAGGVAGGGVAGAAGINVADIRNDTTAFIAGNVSAQDRVSVAALSDQDVEGVIFSGAGGGIGLAAAVGVYGIGGNLDQTYTYLDQNGNPTSGSAYTASQNPSTSTQTAVNQGTSGTQTALTPTGSSGQNNPASTTVANTSTAIAGNNLAGLTTPVVREVQFGTGTTAFIGQGAEIAAGGDVDIDARQNSQIDIIAGGVSLGFLGASGGIVIANVDNDVSAFIASDTVTSAGRNISVDADLMQTIEATSFAGSGSFGFAAAVGVSYVKDTSDVIAYIGSGAKITSAKTISVKANSDQTLLGESVGIAVAGGAAAAAAITVMESDGETTAYVGEDAQIGVSGDVENLSITASSFLKIDDPNSDGMVIGGSASVFAAAAGVAVITDSRDTTAYIGAGSDIRTTGDLTVRAKSESDLTAKAYGGAGGLLAVGAMIGRVNVTSATTAEIRGSSARRTNIEAGTLSIESSASSVATVNTVSGSIGLFGGRGSSAEATLDVDSHAGIGENVDVVTAGDFSILGRSKVEGDAEALAGGGGLVDVGVSIAKVTINPADESGIINPSTTAFVETGTVITSGGSVSIMAISGGDAETYDPNIQTVDAANDTILLFNADGHGLATGDVVQLDGSVAGLEEDRNYNVISVDGSLIQLGEFFQEAPGQELQIRIPASAIDMASGDITAADHGLQTGDVITWDRSSDDGEGLADLTANFYVIVVDANTFALADTGAQAQNGIRSDMAFDASDFYDLSVAQEPGIDSEFDVIRFAQEHAFETGDQVRYVAPAPLVVTASALDVENGNISYLNDGLATGDEVLWENSEGEVGTYYVIKNVDGTFGLAASAADAANGILASFLTDRTYTLTPIAPEPVVLDGSNVDSDAHTITIVDHGLETGDEVMWRSSDEVNGTFFVIVINGDEISLALSKADADNGNRTSTAFDDADTYALAVVVPDATVVVESPVDVENGQISVTNHGLATGDQVTWQENDGTSGIYYVIAVDDNTIGLAASKADAEIGMLAKFLGNEQSVYTLTPQPDSGLIDGDIYTVNVIDAFTIKLIAEGMAQPSQTFNSEGVVEDGVFTIAGHGFSDGDAVTYDGPTSFDITIDRVSIELAEVDHDNDPSTDPVESYVFDENSDALLIPNHGFASGDQLIYGASDSSPVIGDLIDGETYTVTVVDEQLITLTDKDGNLVDINRDDLSEDAVHNFYLVGQTPLPGLTEGKTYYIVGATTDTFQLSETPGGAAIEMDGPALAGDHTLSVEGIDLGTGWGTGTLVIDLEGGGSGKLLGEDGVPLEEVVRLSGDGKTSATAKGFGVSLIGVTSNTATVELNPYVTAMVAADQITTTNIDNGDINITAENRSQGTVAAETFAIGFFGGGKTSAAYAIVDDTTSVEVSGGTALTAAGSINMDTLSNHRWTVNAKAEGGGLIDFAGTFAAAEVNVTNDIIIGDGASLQAEDQINIHALTQGSAYANAWVSNGGLGAQAGTNELHALPDDAPVEALGGQFVANTKVKIGKDAVLTADRLFVKAAASTIFVTGIGDTTTGGLGTDGDAAAPAILTATTAIEIGAGAQLTGHYGVVLQAHNNNNTTIATATSRNRAFAGDTDATARSTLNLTSNITAAAGAAVYAGPGVDPGDTIALLVEAKEFANVRIENATTEPGVIDFGEANKIGAKLANNEIIWNADVHIHTGARPKLVIGEDGQIETAINITVNDGKGVGDDLAVGDIVVDDIDSHQYGQVVFNADGSVGPELVTGSAGTFHLLDTYSSVFIENRSSKNIVIQNIDVQADTEKTDPDVIIDATTNVLQFSVSESGSPTLVDIHNLRASSITFNGTIENSKGETIIRNDMGDILSLGDRGVVDDDGRSPLIITHTLDMDAPLGNIGANGATINVDLVGYGDDTANIRVDAGGDIHLDLKARERVFNADPITMQIDHIQAGDNIDLTLQTGVREQVALATGLVEVLSENDGVKYAVLSGYVTTHYRDDLTQTKPETTIGGTVTDSQDVTTTYAFVDRLESGTPGLIAGGNLDIRSATIGAADDPRVNIFGLTDVGETGVINVLTNGYVDLIELAGDMNIGRIESRYDDVKLLALSGDILDAFEDEAADIIGANLTLRAVTGVIGGKGETDPDYRSLDLDSRAEQGGTVFATALGDIYLIETAGGIKIDLIRSTIGDVRLETSAGSILDAGNDGATDIEATNIDMVANGGGIGSVLNDVEIDSSSHDTGRLMAVSDLGIFLTETSGALHVLRAESKQGSVRLRTPDTGLVSAFDGEGAGEDLIFLSSGETLLDQTYDHALISGATAVTLEIGDDVTMASNSVIAAGSSVIIRGDHGNADIGEGTHMLLQGEIRPTGDYAGYEARIYGHSDADEFVLNELFLGGQTRIFGAGNQDLFVVNHLKSMTAPLKSHADGSVSGYALTLDGQADADSYIIRTVGSDTLGADGQYHDYVINVLDTGSLSDGVDNLEIFGSEANSTATGDDIFLMRRLSSIPGEAVGGDPGMVALLHGTLEQTMTASGDPADRPQEVERINYDSNINGQISVFGLSGNDHFASDDTTAVMTLDGGTGNDSFQIGQLFGDKRTSDAANLGAADVFGTRTTTRGELSRGNSEQMTAIGGDGDDVFTVYSNQALLQLDGNDGDDSFTVQAFAMAPGAPDEFTTMTPTLTTPVPGEDVRYSTNAPVAIDGGDGFDKATVIGTEFDDVFVITADGITGAGLNVTVEPNTETREVDGFRGDDTFYVLSTPAGVNTRVIGGQGNDIVNVGAGTQVLVDHDLSAMQGPIEVIGGVFVERTLSRAVIMPGELNAPLPDLPPSSDPEDLMKIDTLNVYDDLAISDREGVLTGTNLSGFALSDGLSFAHTAYGEPAMVAAGITYGDGETGSSEIEIFNLFMGQGNDELTIASTLMTNAEHGGITTVHGGGNRLLADGLQMGGDLITVLGGGGSLSPLVIFGDTSEDGAFYAADAAGPAASLFGLGDIQFSYPLAHAFDNEGNDIIDASAAFAGHADADLPSVGVSVYGGGGNDLIIGSQAGDHLAGGSGDDTIHGEDGDDHIYGDAGLNIDPVSRTLSVPTTDLAGRDLIDGGRGADIIFGDHGVIGQTAGAVRLLTTGQLVSAATTEPLNGDDDVIDGGDQNDWVFGGNGSDRVYGGIGDDVLIGDHGYIDGTTLHSTDLPIGGSDVIYAGEGDDVVIGGAHGDMLDGEAGYDLIFGDNVRLVHSADSTDPRFRTLHGGQLFDDQGNALVDGTLRFDNPDQIAAWAGWTIVDLDHDAGIEAAGSANFGDDYIAGGADDDMIFGQLGNDIVQGDGSIIGADVDGVPVGAARHADGSLDLSASFDAATDGDDYIEGNGGDDVIFGNQGQDDIVGGSSSLFSLATSEQRPDGSDILFGGSGTYLARNEIGDTSAQGHARDADVILGDNGNIFRIVDETVAYRTFNYDNYTQGQPAGEQLRIIPRAFELLDYTIGGGAVDLGASDLVYGGTGDDIIHGMTGNDVLYGNGRDDDLYGGAGHDILFGGSGEDGMLGDDGLLRTERNGTAEPLYGLDAGVQTSIGIPGPFTGAVVDIEGRIKKTAVILQPDTITLGTEGGFHDIMYGGLGDDWMHGGYGNDAMSGAEALSEFYRDTTPQTDAAPIGYDPDTRKLSYYDADNPLQKIDGFFLNFETIDDDGEIIEDGKDRIFGDTGHDWIVGGTGHDRLFGGGGDDLLQADDYLDTNGGANDQADHSAWGDFAYGGAGLDVLIANSGFDRLFDWTGEFNSFVVPFARFGLPTVNRVPSPHVVDFLLELGEASGADTRLSEPNGELGLVTQKDDAWDAQHGAPRDPQPGNGDGQYDNAGGPEDDTDKITTADGSTPGGRPPLFVPDDGGTSPGPLDAILTVNEDDLPGTATDSSLLVFEAGSEAITSIVFSPDASTIVVSGLDDAAVLNWMVSSDGRSLVANLDGVGVVLQIDLFGPMSIAAGGIAEVSIQVTLLAAMPHEDDVNVDSLTIAGINVIASDAALATITGTVSVIVIDDLPFVDIIAAVPDDTPWFDGVQVCDTISGTWNFDEGADTASLSLLINGTLHDLDSLIDVVVDGVDVGVLVVASDGTWSFSAAQSLNGPEQLNFSFSLLSRDIDGDTAVAVHDIGIGDGIIPVPTPDPDPNPDPNPKGKGNNGVGNGVDPQPPGEPPINDDEDDFPADPGNKGGPSAWDDPDALFTSSLDMNSGSGDGVLMTVAANPTPSALPVASEISIDPLVMPSDQGRHMVFDEATGEFVWSLPVDGGKGRALPELLPVFDNGDDWVMVRNNGRNR